ncbi:MAG: B12-binding domain-containing radical SAM protein [Deltaproteobacteria bacterium]|nr:B12-binding domain-containing radical SAM protein [Deltaproteobacteria bacterium]
MLSTSEPAAQGASESTARSAARIALIRPPAVSSLHAYSAAVVPPLGPAYIAAALETAGHEVHVVDALGEAPLSRYPSAHPRLVAHGLTIPEIVARIPLDIQGVGVSVMFSQQWPHVAALLRAIRSAFADVPIFIGGEHATAAWRYVLENCPEVTLCALGEGEETVVDVADWIADGGSLDRIPGIAFRLDDGMAHKTPPRQRIRSVDEIPRPAWHLFPLENYLSKGFGHGVHLGRSIPMLATRGCPYRCTFCSSPDMWTTRYYVRPVAAVVDEIEYYVERYGISNIDFEDLTAFIKRDWILAFCHELERRGLRVTYQLPSGTRSEALDADVLTALARSGCRNLTYAPESGSARTLKDIKKKVNPKRVLESMRIAKSVGVNIKANLMIGFPDETRRDLLKTLWFGLRASWMGVDDIPLFPFSPYPGTSLYEDLRREGKLPAPDDDYFAGLGYMDMMRAPSSSRHIGTLELNLYRILGMSAFYVLSYARRPWRVWRTIRNVRAGRSETVLEQRLVESKRRRVIRKWPVSGFHESANGASTATADTARLAPSLPSAAQ